MGQIKIKDHLSPAEAEVGAELSNIPDTIQTLELKVRVALIDVIILVILQ